MKKKIDFATKAKLIYSGELLVFAIAFLTIAILEFTQVIKISERHHLIFNWLTVFGGTWLIVDLFWAIFDKKRQKRIALIDKIVHAPIGVYLIAFDLFCLISKPSDPMIYQIGIPIALSYLSLSYIFEAIYHFKYPIPGLIEEEETKINKAENQEVSSEEENNDKTEANNE